MYLCRLATVSIYLAYSVRYARHCNSENNCKNNSEKNRENEEKVFQQRVVGSVPIIHIRHYVRIGEDRYQEDDVYYSLPKSNGGVSKGAWAPLKEKVCLSVNYYLESV
jgi:hypothetical protein